MDVHQGSDKAIRGAVTWFVWRVAAHICDGLAVKAWDTQIIYGLQALAQLKSVAALMTYTDEQALCLQRWPQA